MTEEYIPDPELSEKFQTGHQKCHPEKKKEKSVKWTSSQQKPFDLQKTLGRDEKTS